MSELLVIGVGNPYRHDDGVGLAVLAEVERRAPPGVRTAEESGEPAALIARWAGHDRVVLVDAISSSAAPGTVHRMHCCDGRWTVPPPARQASTHGLGVAEAVELGRVLDQIPRELLLLGVTTGDVSEGTGLSPDVAAAVPRVVDLIAAEARTTPPARPSGTRERR